MSQILNMPTKAVSQQKIILLVEDYPAGMLVGTLILEHLGYKVETADSGHAAIEKLLTAPQHFLAILMDVQMQDIDGFEATKIIRELEFKGTLTQENIIIAITAHALAGDRDRCLKAGMNDYISKPLHPDILAKKLALL